MVFVSERDIKKSLILEIKQLAAALLRNVGYFWVKRHEDMRKHAVYKGYRSVHYKTYWYSSRQTWCIMGVLGESGVNRFGLLLLLCIHCVFYIWLCLTHLGNSSSRKLLHHLQLCVCPSPFLCVIHEFVLFQPSIVCISAIHWSPSYWQATHTKEVWMGSEEWRGGNCFLLKQTVSSISMKCFAVNLREWG